MAMPRVVTAETLDHLAAADPAAQRSRRDLMRVHRAMGTRSIVARGWQALWPTPATLPRTVPGTSASPLKVLEIGAGDGTLLLAVARALAPTWPAVQLTLLDRQNIVSPTTLASYAELGWSARAEVVDVLDWAAASASLAPSWDLITASLFLHHFKGAQLERLISAIASRSQRFFACEPRRAPLALAGSHLVGALGANAVTREDAVLSVHAGFRAHEVTELWPGPGTAWQTHEYAAGLFSHCFSAQRTEAR